MTKKGIDFLKHGFRLLNSTVSGKKKGPTLENPHAVNVNGLLIDMDIQPVNDNPSLCDNKC